VEKHGSRKALGTNIGDAVLTVATFGVGHPARSGIEGSLEHPNTLLGRLTEKIDEEGDATEYEYNDNGQITLSRSTAPGEAPVVSRFLYHQAPPGVADMTDANIAFGTPDQRDSHFDYDLAGSMTGSVDPTGGPRMFDPLTGNRYMYAGSNPANMIDDGHAPECKKGSKCKKKTSIYDATASLDRWAATTIGKASVRTCSPGVKCVEDTWVVWPGAYAWTEGHTIFCRKKCGPVLKHDWFMLANTKVWK